MSKKKKCCYMSDVKYSYDADQVACIPVCCSVVGIWCVFFFFFQAEDGIRDDLVTGVQTCALPIFGVEVRASRAMLEPAAFGVLRPVLLMPAGIKDRLSITQFDAIDRKSVV